MPYQERWRERPDETRQPVLMEKVPNPAAKRKMRILNVISAHRIARSAFLWAKYALRVIERIKIENGKKTVYF